MSSLLTLKFLAAGGITASVAAAGGVVLLTRVDYVVIGNYESYIDDNIAAAGKSEYNVKFDQFSEDKYVSEKLSSKAYDAAIVSNTTQQELQEKGLLKKIDWSKLGLICPDSHNIKITNDTEAKELYSENTNQLLDSNADYLKYGIPYFLNHFSFFYRGAAISELSNATDWSSIVDKIAAEDRFNPKSATKPEVGMIDDNRSVFSLSSLASGANNLQLTSGSETLENINKKFAIWDTKNISKSKKQNQYFYFESDSQKLLDKLAKKEIQGAFMYNGDAATAILQLGRKDKTPDTNAALDFHTVKPTKKMFMLDSLVISKDISKKKEGQLYKFIKKAFFEGHNETDMFKLVNGTRKYWPAQNFDHVFYTPVLKNMINQLKTNKTYAQGLPPKYEPLLKEVLLIDDNDSIAVHKGKVDANIKTNISEAYTTWKTTV